jgi:hypothetical protein
VAVAGVDTGEGRELGVQGGGKLEEVGGGALAFDGDAVGIVPDLAGEKVGVGESEDEGAEADTLDGAANVEAVADEWVGGGKRHGELS